MASPYGHDCPGSKLFHGSIRAFHERCEVGQDFQSAHIAQRYDHIPDKPDPAGALNGRSCEQVEEAPVIEEEELDEIHAGGRKLSTCMQSRKGLYSIDWAHVLAEIASEDPVPKKGSDILGNVSFVLDCPV